MSEQDVQKYGDITVQRAFGMLSSVDETQKSKAAKGQSQGPQRNVLIPKVHDDSFYLRMSLPANDAGPNTPPTVRWERPICVCLIPSCRHTAWQY